MRYLKSWDEHFWNDHILWQRCVSHLKIETRPINIRYIDIRNIVLRSRPRQRLKLGFFMTLVLDVKTVFRNNFELRLTLTWVWFEVKVEFGLRLSWGWGWDLVEMDLWLRLSWGRVEVVLRLSWGRVEIELELKWS